MSDEQIEQERYGYPEATTIGPNVNAAQLELDIDAISRRTRKFLVEQQNTIDRLTAERDAARAEVERLRAACAGISEGLIRTATHGVENLTKRDWLIQTAQNIRVALESEAGE